MLATRNQPIKIVSQKMNFCGVNDGVSTQTRPRQTAAVVAEEKVKLIDHLGYNQGQK